MKTAQTWRGFQRTVAAIGFAAWVNSAVLFAWAVDFPGPRPGEAKASLDGTRLRMENEVLAATFDLGESGIVLAEFTDKLSRTSLPGPSAPCTLLLKDAKGNHASPLRPHGKPTLERVEANAQAVRAAERCAGWRAVVPWTIADSPARGQCFIMLRDGSNYLRQEIVLKAEGEPLEAATLTFVHLAADAAKTWGEVDGSPVVRGTIFAAGEHPMATNEVAEGKIVCRVGTFRRLAPAESCARSCVIGVAPAGQLRRGFLYYLERERARPYQPFLHYNSWYDIAWGDRKMNEGQCLTVIELFGRELIEKRGVKLDSLVFDDGWDDNRSLWRFHPGFPRGFAPLREAAERYGTAIGVWLSPWGGYGAAKEERMRYGKTQGFETNENGFSLAGPNYYGRFREVCAEMIQKYGVNYFKYDGIAAGLMKQGAGPQYAADVDGLLRLISDLRTLRPDLFVNVTTGTWPSPFWLLWGDSVWRNGDDMGFFGPGSKRQQWITYRDLYTYQGVVRRGPLYPISSLMNQGICHANLGNAHLPPDLKDMADEVYSFFGSGTQTQELYITPQRLTGPMWDLLADGARWSRKNADVLADAHWIGGDPGQGQVYGYAAWSPRLGILTLRNPSDAAASFSLEIGQAFELPPSAPKQYVLKRLWKQGPAETIQARAGQPQPIALAPFEVAVFEASAKD
jgi:hypothetical protein